MKETQRLLDELIAKAEDYGYSSLELAKLKSIKVVANTSGKIGVHFAIWAVIVLFFLMLSIGVSLYLGELWGHHYLGFLAVAGFYLLLAIVLRIFKVPLVQRPIANFVVKKIQE